MQFKCAHCGQIADKRSGEINRARAAGQRLFCNRKCAGLGRRKPPKSKAQRAAEKRAYDMEYRRKNRAVLKAKKAARHKATYDPAAARIERKKRAAFHAEYCRRPSYRLWKREYDRRYRAREYGPFADVYTLTLELNREIKGRMTNHEIRWENGTSNKSQRRARKAGEKERSRPRYRDRRRDHSATHG